MLHCSAVQNLTSNTFYANVTNGNPILHQNSIGMQTIRLQILILGNRKTSRPGKVIHQFHSAKSRIFNCYLLVETREWAHKKRKLQGRSLIWELITMPLSFFLFDNFPDTLIHYNSRWQNYFARLIETPMKLMNLEKFVVMVNVGRIFELKVILNLF